MIRAIGPDLVATLSAALSPLDTDAARDAYRRGDFPRADAVRDLDKRYRWDLYWAAGSWRIWDLPDAITDAHIDTALRTVVRPLGSVTA
jgi:hypothetical protein